MPTPPKYKPAQRFFVFLLIVSVSFVLGGCKGIPTPGERHARQEIQNVGQAYRPQGQKPPLPSLEADSGLSNYLQYAFLNSPQVEDAYFDWAASVERITAVRSFPDPQLTFQMDIQSIVTSVMPGLMMTFPGLGKRHAGADVASMESEAKFFVFQSRALQTAFEVKSAYYQLHFLEEKIRVNQETLRLLADLESLARTQNEVGKVTLQDVLRAQIEQARLRTEIATLIDSQTSLMAQFKAALGLGGDQPAPPMPQHFESTPLNVAAEKMLESAMTNNTRLKSIEAELRSAEAAITLAYKARMPDSSLGLMADAKMSPTLYRPLGTVSLPIWRDKLAAQLAEAQANKRVVQARLSAEQISLAVDIAEKSFVSREASRNLKLLQEELLPKSRQSLDVARSGYLSGRLDFFNLIDTERTLLGFELEEVEAHTRRELSMAELSLIVSGMPPSGASTPGGGREKMSRPGASSGGANGMR